MTAGPAFLPARKNRLFNRLIYWALVLQPARAAFSGVYARGLAPPSADGAPVILLGNHSSWWDAHMMMLLNERALRLDGYVMVEDKQLSRYPFFRALGAFSVNRSDPRSAVRSIDYAAATLAARPGRMLLIFPQGRLLANGIRPLGFETGVAHIVRRLGRCVLLPVALRYEFIGEQKPEAFISLAPEIVLDGSRAVAPKTLSADLERVVTEELDRLCADVAAFRFEDFAPLVKGAPGINRLWDRLRGKGQMDRLGPR